VFTVPPLAQVAVRFLLNFTYLHHPEVIWIEMAAPLLINYLKICEHSLLYADIVLVGHTLVLATDIVGKSFADNVITSRDRFQYQSRLYYQQNKRDILHQFTI